MKISNSPLAKKLLFLIVLSSTIITFIIIVIQLFFEYKTEVSHIKSRLVQIESSYIKPLTLSVWTYDKSQYEAQLNGILNIQDVAFAKIIMPDGKEFISKGKKHSGDKITKKFDLKNKIHNKDVNLGVLIVEASLSRVYDDLYKRALTILLTQGFKTLIISFVILYLFHILVTRYLYLISSYTKKLDLDSNEHLVLNKKYKGDEIDNINQAINDMQDRLRKQNNELKNINEKLEKKVNERTKKIQELMLFQNKMASMGKMIENIAHQWRQPLSSINTSIMLLDKKLLNKGVKEDEIIDELDAIEYTTSYLSKTIDDIRDFYSKEKKQQQFYIYETIESSINIIKSLLSKHNIQIIKDMDTTIEIESYKNDLRQVLLSIISNAKDVLVKNKVKKPTIKIKLYKSKTTNKNIIEISDNGGGIDEKTLPKIFDLYFTTKAKESGSGIGLYISKMIIEQSLNGQIEANNTKEGAVFKIIL